MDEPIKPDHLGEKGSAFWDGVTKDHKFDVAGYAVVENICRTMDVIHKLNGALNSRHQEWVKLVEESGMEDPDVQKIMVVVNPLLGEIRQQRLALRQLIAHLHIGKVAGSQTAPTSNFWESMNDVETAYANS